MNRNHIFLFAMLLLLLSSSDVLAAQTSYITAIGNIFDKIVENKDLMVIIPTFWVFGLLLGLTPCAIPLILMMTSVYGSTQTPLTKLRAISLSLTYIIILALLYAAFGILIATLGLNFQAFMQNNIVRVIFSSIFILFGLSLLGLFQLKIAHKSLRMINARHKLHSYGAYIETIYMGILATLIAAPCIIAPLVGVLTYIASVGNIKLGGIALFFTGVGFGTPLLAFYSFGSEIIQKAGEWQYHIKQFFGLLLMGIAILLLNELISPRGMMLLWAALAIFTAVYMGVFVKKEKKETEAEESDAVCSLDGEEVASKKIPQRNMGAMAKMFSLMILLYGIILLIGALIGNENPFAPLESKHTTYSVDSKNE